MCFRCLTEEATCSASGQSSALSKDPAFQTLMTELRSQKEDGFAIHPKLETLKALVIDHFGQQLRDDDASTISVQAGDDTRAMVFVTFREAVDEIVDLLNQESPLLRATKFIGQGIDKKGNKGLTQREQQRVSPMADHLAISCQLLMDFHYYRLLVSSRKAHSTSWWPLLLERKVLISERSI
jgi:ATP-dependent DNA helicase MPH1